MGTKYFTVSFSMQERTVGCQVFVSALPLGMAKPGLALIQRQP